MCTDRVNSIAYILPILRKISHLPDKRRLITAGIDSGLLMSQINSSLIFIQPIISNLIAWVKKIWTILILVCQSRFVINSTYAGVRSLDAGA
jgi:hypothetical protein